MKKSLIALAVLAACGAVSSRAYVGDAAIKYRMDVGYPGDVNRTHPFSVVPAQMDGTTPVRRYGDPVLYGTNTVRGFVAADQAGTTKIKGVLVRPYPTSQTSGGMSSSFGVATPPGANSVVDFIEDGFVIVKIDNIAAGNPTKGGAVFVWSVASAGNDVLGGFRAAASAGNTCAITNAEFTGPADANGYAEIRVWKQ